MGAIEFIIKSRSASLGANQNRTPTPRSKPSITTYIATPNRRLAVDLPEERQEFVCPVARQAFADNLAGRHIERGEERRRAVALVVMGHRFKQTEPALPTIMR